MFTKSYTRFSNIKHYSY